MSFNWTLYLLAVAPFHYSLKLQSLLDPIQYCHLLGSKCKLSQNLAPRQTSDVPNFMLDSADFSFLNVIGHICSTDLFLCTYSSLLVSCKSLSIKLVSPWRIIEKGCVARSSLTTGEEKYGNVILGFQISPKLCHILLGIYVKDIYVSFKTLASAYVYTLSNCVDLVETCVLDEKLLCQLNYLTKAFWTSKATILSNFKTQACCRQQWGWNPYEGSQSRQGSVFTEPIRAEKSRSLPPEKSGSGPLRQQKSADSSHGAKSLKERAQRLEDLTESESGTRAIRNESGDTVINMPSSRLDSVASPIGSAQVKLPEKDSFWGIRKL